MKRIFNFIVGLVVLVLLITALFSVGTIILGVFTALVIISAFVNLFKRKPKVYVLKTT